MLNPVRKYVPVVKFCKAFLLGYDYSASDYEMYKRIRRAYCWSSLIIPSSNRMSFSRERPTANGCLNVDREKLIYLFYR